MLRTHQTFKEGRKRVTIQYMPAGESVIDATVNGDPARRTVRVDSKTAARLQEDLEAAHARSAAGQAAAPCGYFDHRSGPASFRPVRFTDGGSRGVLLEVELTEAGRKALEGGDYGYFSPTFRRDKATGEVLGLRADTVEVGSLVNDPAFQTIEQIAAARANAEAEDSDGEENVSTARPLAFSKEKQSKKFPPAEFYEDDEEDGAEEDTEKPAHKGKAPATHIPPAVAKDIDETTEENDRAFLKEWKNCKKKPTRKAETAEASRTFLQAWGQHQAEQVEAANPYGCNQYGHEWKGKHGEGWKPSGRGADNANTKKKDESKNDEKPKGATRHEWQDFDRKFLNGGQEKQEQPAKKPDEGKGKESKKLGQPASAAEEEEKLKEIWRDGESYGWTKERQKAFDKQEKIMKAAEEREIKHLKQEIKKAEKEREDAFEDWRNGDKTHAQWNAAIEREDKLKEQLKKLQRRK